MKAAVQGPEFLVGQIGQQRAENADHVGIGVHRVGGEALFRVQAPGQFEGCGERGGSGDAQIFRRAQRRQIAASHTGEAAPKTVQQPCRLFRGRHAAATVAQQNAQQFGVRQFGGAV